MKSEELKNIKEKGITLVALVVTIIILLILAGVTLSIAVSDNGLFQRAKKATEKYGESAKNETELIQEVEKKLEEIEKEEKNQITFYVGSHYYDEDYVECTSPKGWTWKQWIESEYNTINAALRGLGGTIRIGPENNEMLWDRDYYGTEYYFVVEDDPIFDGHHYYMDGAT